MLVIRDIFLVSTWKWNSPSFRVCSPPCVHPLCSNPLKDPQVLTKWTSQRMLSSQDASRIRQPGRWTAPAAICVGPVFYFYVDVDLYGIDFYERYDRYCRISKAKSRREILIADIKNWCRVWIYSQLSIFFLLKLKNVEVILNHTWITIFIEARLSTIRSWSITIDDIPYECVLTIRILEFRCSMLRLMRIWKLYFLVISCQIYATWWLSSSALSARGHYEWSKHKIFLGLRIRSSSWRTAGTGWAMERSSSVWLITPQSIFKQSVFFCRLTPACFAWLSILIKDSPCTRIGAPNCIAVRGVAKCRRTSSPFLMELMSTCSPVRTIMNESQWKHDEPKWKKVASLEIDDCLGLHCDGNKIGC